MTIESLPGQAQKPGVLDIASGIGHHRTDPVGHHADSQAAVENIEQFFEGQFQSHAFLVLPEPSIASVHPESDL